MTAFTPEQVKALDAPLIRDNVKQREQAGRKLSYIEGWHAIAEANRIFGYDNWTRETFDVRAVNEKPREIGTQKKPGWSVSYIAKVRVIAGGVVREGIGAGHGIDVDLGLAHESAIKEAETDAMKRALMTFGNPFGLALYDKTQANVADEEAGPTMSDRLMEAERLLREDANLGMEALNKRWEAMDNELCKALVKMVNDQLVPLAKRVDAKRKAA